MRNVALAALAILIVAPESLFHPSFEMSFAAVIGLVALYEWLTARARNRLFDVSPLWRSLRWGSALCSAPPSPRWSPAPPSRLLQFTTFTA
jgi:competence protein ComEC